MRRPPALVRAALLAAMAILAPFADAIARYGAGNYLRKDQLPAGSPLHTAADAGLILFSINDYEDASHTRLLLGDAGLCPGNPVAPDRQLRVRPPSCSATLVSRNRIITAAHCLSVQGWTDANGHLNGDLVNVLADFTTTAGAADATLPVDPANVRSIRKVLYCKWNIETDIAVLELNAAFQRAPVRRSCPELVKGQNAHLISFPLGLPLVMSTCAGAQACVQATISMLAPTWFRAPLDSFHGSSGGGVVGDDGRLIGVFRGGPPQLEPPKPPHTLCSAEIVYAADCLGDFVSRVDQLANDLFDDAKELPEVNCSFGADPAWNAQCPARDNRRP